MKKGILVFGFLLLFCMLFMVSCDKNKDNNLPEKDPTTTGQMGETPGGTGDAGTRSACEINGHTVVTDAALAATCSRAGKTAGSHCSVCGAVLAEQKEVPAVKSAHRMENGACLLCGRTYSEGLEFTYDADADAYVVTGSGSCTDADVIIPEEYQGKPVIAVGKAAFDFWEELESIWIPGNVQELREAAFVTCNALTSVSFSENSTLTTVGPAAFRGCMSLENIQLPDSVISMGAEVFSACLSLTGIRIPAKMTGIPESAFFYCPVLRNVILPEGLLCVGARAFIYCEGLEQISLPVSVTVLAESAFEDCTALKSVEIPVGVHEIGARAFSGCTALVSVLFSDGSALESVGEEAFYCCESLEKVFFPSGVREIGSKALSGCSVLETVELPPRLTEIAGYLFMDCTSLSQIRIPAGVTSVGAGAFWLCMGLKNVTFAENSALCRIETRAFYECRALAGIHLPSGVEAIEKEAFYYCESLAFISVEAGNPTYFAAGNCLIETATKTLVLGCKTSRIPKGGIVRAIGAFAFFGCTGLTGVEIPAEITEIGNGAFASCRNLTGITVDEQNSVFYSKGNCLVESATGKLIFGSEKSVIPAGVREIGDYAFYGADSLFVVELPEGIVRIGKYAFAECTGLEGVTMPDSVTEIGVAAFYGCSALAGIVFRETGSLEKIDSYAFGGCENLQVLRLSGTLKSVGAGAFCDCLRLTKIDFYGSREQWKALSKADGWDDGRYPYFLQVSCLDGNA